MLYIYARILFPNHKESVNNPFDLWLLSCSNSNLRTQSSVLVTTLFNDKENPRKASMKNQNQKIMMMMIRLWLSRTCGRGCCRCCRCRFPFPLTASLRELFRFEYSPPSVTTRHPVLVLLLLLMILMLLRMRVRWFISIGCLVDIGIIIVAFLTCCYIRCCLNWM